MIFTECTNAEELLAFFDNDERSLGHTNYYHYTKLGVADKIFEGKSLWLSSLAFSANDIPEREWHQNNCKHTFSLCFSTGTMENIPLWYLYSGIDGRGARLGIKKSKMKALLKQAKFMLVELDGDKKTIVPNTARLLEPDEYRLVFRDIMYISQNKKRAYQIIKYNNESLCQISNDDIEKVEKKYKRFIKNVIWFYEKETRLEIEILNHNLLSDAGSYVVQMDISPIINDIEVKLAPELEDVADINQADQCNHIPRNQITLSSYKGQLDMKLKTH